MKQLPIYSISEREPALNEKIITFIREGISGGRLDMTVHQVTYVWEEIDLGGNEVGNTYYFEEDIPSGVKCKKVLVGSDSNILDSSDLYATLEDIRATFA